MKQYQYATVLCVCGREVGRVPCEPATKRCACGARLSFEQTSEGLQPIARLGYKPRAWNPRRLVVLAATEAHP